MTQDAYAIAQQVADAHYDARPDDMHPGERVALVVLAVLNLGLPTARLRFLSAEDRAWEQLEGQST
jgi:hypothetical protein